MSLEFSREQAIKRNDILCRNYLGASESQGINPKSPFEEVGDLTFYRILGLSDFWKKEEKIYFDSIMGDIINGLVKYNITFAYLLIGDGFDISLCIGVSTLVSDTLKSSLYSSYPFIELKANPDFNSLKGIAKFGGILTGYPTNKTKDENFTYQIEKVCKGFYGKQWVYMVLAKCLSPIQVNLTHTKLLKELNNVNDFLKSSVTGGPLGNQTIESIDFTCQNYFDNIQVMAEKVKIGTSRGMWRVCSYYASTEENTAEKLRSILKAIYSGEESKPEILRGIPVQNIDLAVSQFKLLSEIYEESDNHPAGLWEVEGLSNKVDCFKYRYQTIMTSDDVATLCQIPRREVPGYFINNYVEFEVAKRTSFKAEQSLGIGEIVTGIKNDGSDEDKSRTNPSTNYMIDIDDLNRHGLIIGITGGGKTNTSKNILKELWVTHKKPFLVIESAKREYWELFNIDGFSDLLLFTLGSEEKSNSIPNRINPFEVIKGVSLQTHIDYLLSTFKASFELYPPMPYVLETCIYEVYEDRGWDVLNNYNTYGRGDYPTLSDLYYKVDIVTDRLGYQGEVQSNVKAALKARINSLRIGGKGAMLDTPRSLPIEVILNKPVILELEDIGDDDVKAFVTGIFLVQLYEYRKAQENTKGKVQHVLLVEEAHRLLANVTPSGDGGNPRAKAVEFFCNLLAEIRSYGQGIFIADQIPSKLASDAIKNTNLKIVHRTVMQEDRELIGHAMNMTPEQIEYLSSLKRGYAAVYAEGDIRPKLVKLPLVKSDLSLKRVDVIGRIKKFLETITGNYEERHRSNLACSYCTSRCQHKDTISNWYQSEIITYKDRTDYVEILDKYNLDYGYVCDCLNLVGEKINSKLPFDLALCFIGELLQHSKVQDSYKNQAIVTFIKNENTRKTEGSIR